jgi:hypothetical protein
MFETEDEALAYIEEAALNNALGAGFAIRFDGVGADLDDRNVINTVLARYFPSAPLFAETWFGWSTAYNVEATYNSFCLVRSNGATFGFNYDDTRALAYDPDFFTNGLKPNDNGDQLGYRILPSKIEFNKEANAGGKLHFSSEWKNKGSGVLYRDHPLGLSLVDASGAEVYFAVRDDFDITTLVKGQTYKVDTAFNLPAADKLAPGTYKIRIALVDKNNNNKSTIKLPLGDPSSESLDYEIGTLKIV